MGKGVPEALRSISRSQWLMRAATTVVLGLILASGIGIWLLRQGAITETENDNHRLGVVLAEQTARTLQSVDLVLQDLVGQIAGLGVHDRQSLHVLLGGKEVRDSLRQRLSDLPQANALAVLDSAGYFVNQSRSQALPDYSVADRDYFRYFATTADPNPYISAPEISRVTGLPTVFLVRRLAAPDGNFLGVVLAPIRLDYFAGFLANIGLSDGTGVTILRRDGIVLVHSPASSVTTGAHISVNVAWAATVAAGGGHYRSRGAFANSPPAFVSVHPLTLYPIVVDVTCTEVAALAHWWQQAIAIATGTLAAAASLTFLLRAVGRQIRLIEKSQQRIGQQVVAIQASEAKFSAQSTLLETTLDHMNQGLMLVDAAGTIAVCNRRASEILGLPPELMADRPSFDEVVEFQKASGEFVGSQGTPIDPATLSSNRSIYERRRPNGTIIEVRSVALPDGGWVRTFTDITARATAEQMLGLAASQDPLTGLANRHSFDTRLDAMLAAARRGNTDLVVLCLDLDRFKAVNDALGHYAGDQVLILVAQRMREIARSTDVVGRLGGDEFAIVLPGASRGGAELACRRLLESIRMPYMLGEETARIGVSIGLATFPTDGATAEQLLRNADTALYLAKAAGRNAWRAYASEDGQREHQRLLLVQDLQAAVELQQFTLAYQPICEAATGEPVAYEALLRWEHPIRGAISPDEFIPIAEQTGMIIPLGRWVIEVACAEAAAWAMDLRIAVNLSPAQFHDQGLLVFIQDVLARTGLSPNRLDLEVTEGVLVADAGDVVKTMQVLRTMGIRMVLDDFGTANSNLGRLRGLPFDAVKIDRSFLRALNSDPQARALVEAILAMARALGLEAIGEGVETAEQLALLDHLHCRWVQGYLLGRPASSEHTRDQIWKLAASSTRNEKAIPTARLATRG